MGSPVFSRISTSKPAIEDGGPDVFESHFIIKVVAGPIVPTPWHRDVLSYFGVINAYHQFLKKSSFGKIKGIVETVITYNTKFLTKEWCSKATVVFIAPTQKATCINLLIQGTHSEYTGYESVLDFEDLALDGVFN